MLSAILDVAIGLILVFLVLSVVTSSVSEYIGSLIERRAWNLERFLENVLLGSGIRVIEDFYNKTLLATQTQNGHRPSYLKAEDFAQALIDSVTAKYLPPSSPAAQPNAAADPSMTEWTAIVNDLWNIRLNETHVISKLSWVERLVHLWKAMRGKPVPPPTGKPPLAQVLSAMINQANGDATKIRKQLQTWYDNSMDRVSGWYKGQTQLLLLVIGLALAIVMNIDTLSITNSLLQNPAIRSTADQLAQKVSSPTDPALSSLSGYLSQLNVPLGWPDPSWSAHPQLEFDFDWWLKKIIGLLVTAFAVSQGAPFWFDLLNKITNLRSAGPKPDTAVASAELAQLAKPPLPMVEVAVPPAVPPANQPGESPRNGSGGPSPSTPAPAPTFQDPGVG
ncbi:MAG: hypothetical protein ACYDBJ_14950 [Aggregatilineales bacterium]